MFDLLVTLALFVAFIYAMMLATNPKGAWFCPICSFLSRAFRSSKSQPERRAQG